MKTKKKKIQAVGVIVIDPATQKVLMLSSRKKEGAYVLPRDDCQTEPTEEHPEKAAIRLLHEKAGVAATFLSSRVGSYAESNKKGRVIAHHWMYEVNAPTLLETWPDATRQRVWVNLYLVKKKVKHWLFNNIIYRFLIVMLSRLLKVSVCLTLLLQNVLLLLLLLKKKLNLSSDFFSRIFLSLSLSLVNSLNI